MCYDVAVMTKKRLDYARKRAEDPETIRELEEEFEKQFPDYPKLYHSSGFAHPYLPCFTHEKPFKPQPLYWGLVPFWAKDGKGAMQIANKTLNARSESMFEKPAFRDAAKQRRCLIYIDHFYEHHHHKGKTYPYLIKLKNDEPIILGGLWSEWINKGSGEILSSCAIVTTAANELMAEIHNNPKLEGPRMPLILPREMQDKWLQPVEEKLDQEQIMALAQPFDAAEMEAYPVGRLRGKNAVGNEPAVLEKVDYAELLK